MVYNCIEARVLLSSSLLMYVEVANNSFIFSQCGLVALS
jgi:hypothetical protein